MDRSFVYLIYLICAAVYMLDIINIYQNVIIHIRKFHDKIEAGYKNGCLFILKNGGHNNV